MTTESDSGSTLITTLSVEQTLSTQTDGAFQFQIDIEGASLADDEMLIVRIYGKVLTGSTERQLFSASVKGSFTDKQLSFPTFQSVYHYKVTIEQQGGTKRTFDWSIFTP